MHIRLACDWLQLRSNANIIRNFQLNASVHCIKRVAIEMQRNFEFGHISNLKVAFALKKLRLKDAYLFNGIKKLSLIFRTRVWFFSELRLNTTLFARGGSCTMYTCEFILNFSTHKSIFVDWECIQTSNNSLITEFIFEDHNLSYSMKKCHFVSVIKTTLS